MITLFVFGGLGYLLVASFFGIRLFEVYDDVDEDRRNAISFFGGVFWPVTLLVVLGSIGWEYAVEFRDLFASVGRGLRDLVPRRKIRLPKMTARERKAS